ncbi:hypothetical protein GE09DRAFT_750908 [Coniochaeta sp. 2T2.1]|nr:hypothetical protein GE09DRAFT_750908 [Coniochaeta sp. 2T2.1]
MFHPSRRRAEPTAYEYNIQATEDHEDDHGVVNPSAEKRRRPRGKRPNYKPTALTWPFIVAQILVLTIAMGLIIWAEKAMPDSDSTAIIDPLPSKGLAERSVKLEFGRQFRRDNSSGVVKTTTSQLDVQETTLTGGDGLTTTGPGSTNGPADNVKTAVTDDTTLTSATDSVATTEPKDKGSTTPSATAPSTTPPSSLSSPTSRTSGDGTGSITRSSETLTNTEALSSSGTLTTSTGESSSDGAGSSTPTSQRGKSAATDSSSVTESKESGSATDTDSSSSSEPTSVSTQSNRNGRIMVDPTATDTTTSLHTSIYTSDFTTTAKSTFNLTSTVTIPEHTTTFNVTKSTVFTTTRTRSGNSTIPASTATVSYTTTATYSSTTVYSSESQEPSTTVIVTQVTSVGESLTTVELSTVATDVPEETIVSSVTVFPTTSEVPATTSETVIQTYVPYLSTGQTVITSVATVIIQPPQTKVETEAPVVIVGTSVGGGQVYTVVQTFAPQTRVVGDNFVPVTEVATPPPQTVVSQIGGTVVNNILVVTPTPTTQTTTFGAETTIGGVSRTFVQTQAPETIVTSQGGRLVTLISTPPPQTQVSVLGGVSRTFVQTQAPQTIVTSQGGRLVTLISTPPPQTQVSVLGGTLTTVPVTTTSSGFQPISYVITTNRGGSTSLVVSTPPPTKVVTTINGTPVTFDSTLPLTTYTTTFGGTEVTETTATTPTASDLITLTFASTIGGTLTTIVQTFAPMTYLTSLSGRLSTITTTPSPSTYLSTAPLSSTTFTSTSNAPSATTSSPPAQTSLIISTKTFDLTQREYFTGTFLPPLLAVSLIIPIRIIDLNAKLYQPFNSLASTQGATGYEALTLQFTGLMGSITPAITLLQGHPVPFITTLMVLCASLMVPLAVEAISLKLHGHCSPLSSQGCAASLGVSPTSAHALLGLTATVIILLLALLFFLRDWVTGLHANPWNLAGIACLARNPDVRIRGSGDASLRRSVADKTYGLGYYETPDGREEYGLLLVDDSGRGLSGSSNDVGGVAGDTESEKLGFATFRDNFGRRKSARALPFMTLRYPWRVVFLGYLLGLLVLIAYYDYTLVVQVKNPTVPHYTSFHLFFDSHSFGIRFLFASLGVVITFCWQAFFVAVATIVPFHSLSNHTQPAARSILVSRPTNAFSGIHLAALKLRHPFYTATSLATVLSEFLPILLSNIPHKLTQVLGPTLVCTRVSMAFLATMIGVLLWSFFIRWPPMPVDPRSVAGMMWYVCESRRMLDDFEGVSGMKGKERDKRVKEMGRRYYYGELVGRSRLGVDVDPGLGEGVVTAYLSGGGLDPAPSEGVARRGGREDGDGVVAGTRYEKRRGQDVVTAVLGRRDG